MKCFCIFLTVVVTRLVASVHILTDCLLKKVTITLHKLYLNEKMKKKKGRRKMREENQRNDGLKSGMAGRASKFLQTGEFFTYVLCAQRLSNPPLLSVVQVQAHFTNSSLFNNMFHNPLKKYLKVLSTGPDTHTHPQP